MKMNEVSRVCVLAAVWAVSMLSPFGGALAATNDVTGLTPTLAVTFDNSSVVNDNGTASFTLSPEGTPTYTNSPNGKAINTAIFTPYVSGASGITTAGSSFSVSAFATLGSNSNGILYCLRDTGSVILRRGAATDTVVMSLGNASTAIITASGIPFADAVYHHYALVATSAGITLYVDGIVKGTATSNAVAAAKTNFQFGSRHGGALAGEAKFGGKIDDFRVYSAALTASQIQSLWSSLTSAAANMGMISIKTGTRDDTAAGGNVSLSGTALGAVPAPSVTWNKTANMTGGFVGAVTNLRNSAEVLSGMKLYYTCPNTYLNTGAADTPNGVLTKTYLDDGTAGSYSVIEGTVTNALPNPGITRGWEAMLTNVPYQHADLYVIIASDQAQAAFKACPVLIKVGDGAWTYYYGAPGLARTMVGNQTWSGDVYSTGALREGNHYVKIQLNNLTTNTAIAIAHGVRNTGVATRLGLAGIQLVKRDSAVGATDDPDYLRTVTGTTNWSGSVWQNAGVQTDWLNSTADRKTTAILTTSGTTAVMLPEESVTAEAVSVKGSGAFTLAGPGALTLNGGAVIDTYGVAATDVVDLSAAIMATNVTLAANNVNASGVGYTKLTNTTNAFNTLTLNKGTLAANSLLPTNSALVMNGGALMFTSSGAFTNPLQFASDARIRVWSGQAAEVKVPLSGYYNLIKSDIGTLVLSGGGTFKNLLWENTGTVRLTGSSPFSLADTTGNGFATTVEVATPVTLSGRLSLGAATLALAEGGAITASALRWCDGGAYSTTANQTGGRIVVTGSDNSVATSASVLFAHWSATTMSYALSGGDFLATNAVAILSWQGKTTWTISGSGRAYVKGVNMKGSSTTDCYGTLNLSGGTLEVGGDGIFASNTSRPRTINLSTGTVRAWNNFTVAASAVSTSVNLKDSATGVTLDSNGKTVTWNAPLGDVGKLVLNDSAVTPGRVRLMAASTHAGGTELRAGTLEAGHVSALSAGPLKLTGGTLDVGAIDATAGALTVTNPATLKVRVSMAADLSGSGSLAPSSVVFLGNETNALQVVLDLNNIDTPLAEYPILLSASIPADATSRMTVAFINGGAGLLPTAAVSLQSRANGVYAVFSGVIAPKNLFWRNGIASGNWSVLEGDTPWGAGSVSGSNAFFSNIDTVNFTDTDQAAVVATVQGSLVPTYMIVSNASTAYTFADAGGSLLTLPSAGFTKRGTGEVAFGLPVAISNATLTVEAGALQVNAALGVVSTATLSSPLSVASNATVSFGGSGTQTLSGGLSGAGTLRVTAGRLKIGASGAALSGDVVAAGGVLEVSVAGGFLSSAARFRVDAGATLELTALDASGYDVTNSKPLDIAGTLKVLQRDSTARGIKLHDGALVLLKGSNMDSGHAMDLFNTPTISLDAGSASFLPIDANDATQATITVRSEHVVKTFDVQASNAVLTVATPLIGGATGNILDKIGPGTLKWTGANTTVARLRASAGTFEIGEAGSLGAGVSAQAVDVLAGATFRYASSTNQTLSGAITCSGSFEMSGSGRLAFSGALTVNAGGELALPGVVAAADAVSVNGTTLTVDGSLRLNNGGSLFPGRRYTLLTSAQILPADIATKVTGLPEYWKAELIDEGKTLIAYKKMGSLIKIL